MTLSEKLYPVVELGWSWMYTGHRSRSARNVALYTVKGRYHNETENMFARFKVSEEVGRHLDTFNGSFLSIHVRNWDPLMMGASK